MVNWRGSPSFHLTRQGFKCWPVSAATLLRGSFRVSQAEPVQLLREIEEPEHDFFFWRQRLWVGEAPGTLRGRKFKEKKKWQGEPASSLTNDSVDREVQVGLWGQMGDSDPPSPAKGRAVSSLLWVESRHPLHWILHLWDTELQSAPCLFLLGICHS